MLALEAGKLNEVVCIHVNTVNANYDLVLGHECDRPSGQTGLGLVDCGLTCHA